MASLTETAWDSRGKVRTAHLAPTLSQISARIHAGAYEYAHGVHASSRSVIEQLSAQPLDTYGRAASSHARVAFSNSISQLLFNVSDFADCAVHPSRGGWAA
eukprot:410566-Pleurochrysis_carterae.AAC.6